MCTHRGLTGMPLFGSDKEHPLCAQRAIQCLGGGIFQNRNRLHRAGVKRRKGHCGGRHTVKHHQQRLPVRGTQAADTPVVIISGQLADKGFVQSGGLPIIDFFGSNGRNGTCIAPCRHHLPEGNLYSHLTHRAVGSFFGHRCRGSLGGGRKRGNRGRKECNIFGYIIHFAVF